MKATLHEKYLPPNYFHKHIDQAYSLIQDKMSSNWGPWKFELEIQSELVEDNSQTTSRFKTELMTTVKLELIQQSPVTRSQTYQVALDMEEYLKYPIPRNIEFPIMEFTPNDIFESKDELKNGLISTSNSPKEMQRRDDDNGYYKDDV